MSVPLIKGSTIYYAEDGSVAVWCPPPVPSSRDREGWHVRRITTGSHGPACSRPGTKGVATEDVMSRRELERVLAHLRDFHKSSGQNTRIVPGTFRWAWESYAPDGHKITDMMIASRIDD